MNLADKWEEVTLMNSKCSESTVDTHSQLYRAVIKNLKEDKCLLHQQKYEYYYQHHLMCSECFAKALEERNKSISPVLKKQYETFYHLETILNHPIILVIDEEELFSHPNELMQLVLNSYRPLYPKKSDLKIQRQCIDSFIMRIKSRIDQLCHAILVNFKEMQESITRQGELRDSIKNLGMMYETHLMEMLGENFVEGSKLELQRVLQDYSNCNQNPFPMLLNNLEDLMTTLASSPFLNTQALAEIYTTVTDDRVWKLDTVITTLDQLNHQQSSTADMIVDFENINLQGQYTMSIKNTEAILQLGSKTIGRLQVQVDSLYHLSNYRLLGVNYDKLMIINYFDHLQIQRQYALTGCTDILPFKDYILAISNDNLIKIDRTTNKWQLVGKGYKNLKYNSKRDIAFSCQNQSDQSIDWSHQIKFVPIYSST